MWGCFRTSVASWFSGGRRHVACRRRERVRPIRFDQRIGAIDRETCLSSALDRRAGASSRRADAYHRLPDHDLPRRVRAGRRPDAPEAAGDPPRHHCTRRPARRTHRPPHLRAAGAAEEHREPADAAAGPDPVLGHGHGPQRHRHLGRHRPPRPRPDPGRQRPLRQRSPARRHHDGTIARGADTRRQHLRHDTAERQRRDGDLAADQVDARLRHRDPGAQRADLGLGRRALGDAVGDHGLRRPDPRLRLPLAIDPRPRRRSHQRRRARPDRHRPQPRPLRPVGLGPVARPDLLVAIDVLDARPRRPPRGSSPSARSMRW